MSVTEPSQDPSPGPSDAGDLGRAQRALVVAATSMLLVSFVGTATNIAVPVLEDAFPDSQLSTVSWVVSAFNVTQVTFMLLGGQLADRLGRRRVFLAGMIVFAIGAVLSGLAPGIELVIAARVVQAVGVALVLPSSLAAVLPLFPMARHATVVSLWSTVGILGAAVAPTVASGLLEVSGWRSVFLVAAPIAVAAFALGRVVLPADVRAARTAPLDIVGAVAGTVAVGGLAFVIVQGRVWGWTDPLILATGALAIAAALVFWRRSVVHPAPLLDLALLRIRTFAVVSVAGGLIATSTAATWFLYPLFMAQVWDYSIFQIGLAITPGPIALILVAMSAGRFADRHGYRGLLIVGSLIAALGTAWMAWRMAPGASYVTSFLPGTVMIGFGMAMVVGPGNSAALRDVPETQLGSANAAYNTLRFLGMALGVAIAAAILGDTEGTARVDAFEATWWAMAAVSATGPLLLWLAYPARAARTSLAVG